MEVETIIQKALEQLKKLLSHPALCYYQLREDSLFLKTLTEAKLSFPAFKKFAHLDILDLEAD